MQGDTHSHLRVPRGAKGKDCINIEMVIAKTYVAPCTQKDLLHRVVLVWVAMIPNPLITMWFWNL